MEVNGGGDSPVRDGIGRESGEGCRRYRDQLGSAQGGWNRGRERWVEVVGAGCKGRDGRSEVMEPAEANGWIGREGFEKSYRALWFGNEGGCCK